MKESRSNNIKVGLITTIGFIVMIILFTWKSGSVVKFSGYEITGEFQNVGGLLETADVRYRGYNVGKVMQIIPEPRSIRVIVKIKKSIQIPADSRLRIAFDGLIGQKYLEIVPGSSTDSVKPGETIAGITSAGIVDFIDEGAKSMQEVQKVLIYVRQFLETQEVQKRLINSAKNLEDVTAQLKNYGPKMSYVIEEISTLVENLNNVVSDPQNQNNVKATFSNAKESTEQLNKIMKSLNEITDNPENKQNLEKILKNLKDITDDLNGADSDRGEGGISKSLKSIKQMAEMKIGLNASLLANPEEKLATGRAGLDLSIAPQKAYHFKLKEDIQAKAINKFSITGENPLTDRSSYHFGIIDSQLGAGVSYDVSDRIRFVTEIYQPSELKGNVQADYILDQNWKVFTAAERIDKNGSDVYVGVGYKK